MTKSKRRLKTILQEKQNGQPGNELTLQNKKQTFCSNLLNLPPVKCSNTNSKLTAMPRVPSYDIILGCNAMKELQLDLLHSENISKI
jgi:hypothetical protein